MCPFSVLSTYVKYLRHKTISIEKCLTKIYRPIYYRNCKSPVELDNLYRREMRFGIILLALHKRFESLSSTKGYHVAIHIQRMHSILNRPVSNAWETLRGMIVTMWIRYSTIHVVKRPLRSYISWRDYFKLIILRYSFAGSITFRELKRIMSLIFYWRANTKKSVLHERMKPTSRSLVRKYKII